MKFKRKLGLAVELGILVVTLPLLLLGCGGGSTGGSTTPAAMQGQFWTDFTGAGIREFTPGSSVSATGNIHSAAFSRNGVYILSSFVKSMVGGVWGIKTENFYYLNSSGWTVYLDPAIISVTNASTFSFADPVKGATTTTISAIDLSGQTIVASSAVPAVTSLGYASSGVPAIATYPSGSFEYVLTASYITTTSGYRLSADPYYAVTTAASSPTPINAVNFNAAGFAAHSTIDPICVEGLFLAHSSGETYGSYEPTPNSGVTNGTALTCQNATIATGATVLGTYDLTFSTVSGVPIASFSNPTGAYLTNNIFANGFIGFLPSLGAYIGTAQQPGSSTYSTYWLNQTAMYSALSAWSLPMF